MATTGMFRLKLRHFCNRLWVAWQSGGFRMAVTVGRHDLLTTSRNRLKPRIRRVFRAVYVSYYRLLFGRPIVGRLSALVHALERRQRREDIPESKEVWDFQYRNKRWDYLANDEEVSRYSVIRGYIQHFNRQGSILDIGCGEGILQERLRAFGYTRYVGLDISEAAIQRAHIKEDAKTVFISGDAESHIPDESFDIMIFNEVLYYFHNPLDSFARYMSLLRERGVVIVSLEDTIRSAAIRQRIKTTYPAVVETKITNTRKNFSWFCTVFAPSQNTRMTR